MGIWIDILRKGASGDRQGARELLDYELPQALRYPSHSAEGTRYKGPLAQAVGRFIAMLPDADRGMARSREEDFIDYVLSRIVTAVERSLLLLEFCIEHAGMPADRIAVEFTGWRGLDRSVADRTKIVRDMLGSMAAAGIPLPPAALGALDPGDGGDTPYKFNEIALALGWDMGLAWNDFKKRQELDQRYRSIDDSESEDDPGVAGEGSDYGLITMAEVVKRRSFADPLDVAADFHIIGEDLGPRVAALMWEMHEARPVDGYPPIAWHNVFWNVVSKYEVLDLELETRDPLCDADQKLADHIVISYLDVQKASRLNIQRRRTRLWEACDNMVLGRLQEWGGMNKSAS